MEELELVPVSATEWLNQLKFGEIGLQSGCKCIYSMRDGIIYYNDNKRKMDSSNEDWIKFLDDGYRSFYILLRKDLCNYNGES